jgi:hypothetical protein
VKLALKVVVQNIGVFVEVILLHLEQSISYRVPEKDHLQEHAVRISNPHSNHIDITFVLNSKVRCSFSRPPLWSSGQSFWLQIQWSWVRSPALPDFLSSSGSGTGSTQPREVN